MSKIYYILIWLTLLLSCKSIPVQHISDVDVTYLRTDPISSGGQDADIEAMIEPYRDQLKDQMDFVIGQLPEDLKKEKPNSNMGNWFCDILHDIAQDNYDKNIAFAIQNYGGLRLNILAKGPLTRGEIFELMPFDNKLVIIEMNAELVTELCNTMSRSKGWPVSRGLSMVMGEYTASDIIINGEPIDDKAIYSVALPDYVANGGGTGELLKNLPQHNTGYYIREGVIEYLEKMQANNIDITIDPTLRIK